MGLAADLHYRRMYLNAEFEIYMEIKMLMLKSSLQMTVMVVMLTCLQPPAMATNGETEDSSPGIYWTNSVESVSLPMILNAIDHGQKSDYLRHDHAAALEKYLARKYVGTTPQDGLAYLNGIKILLDSGLSPLAFARFYNRNSHTVGTETSGLGYEKMPQKEMHEALHLISKSNEIDEILSSFVNAIERSGLLSQKKEHPSESYSRLLWTLQIWYGFGSSQIRNRIADLFTGAPFALDTGIVPGIFINRLIADLTSENRHLITIAEKIIKSSAEIAYYSKAHDFSRPSNGDREKLSDFLAQRLLSNGHLNPEELPIARALTLSLLLKSGKANTALYTEALHDKSPVVRASAIENIGKISHFVLSGKQKLEIVRPYLESKNKMVFAAALDVSLKYVFDDGSPSPEREAVESYADPILANPASPYFERAVLSLPGTRHFAEKLGEALWKAVHEGSERDLSILLTRLENQYYCDLFRADAKVQSALLMLTESEKDALPRTVEFTARAVKLLEAVGYAFVAEHERPVLDVHSVTNQEFVSRLSSSGEDVPHSWTARMSLKNMHPSVQSSEVASQDQIPVADFIWRAKSILRDIDPAHSEVRATYAEVNRQLERNMRLFPKDQVVAVLDFLRHVSSESLRGTAGKIITDGLKNHFAHLDLALKANNHQDIQNALVVTKKYFAQVAQLASHYASYRGDNIVANDTAIELTRNKHKLQDPVFTKISDMAHRVVAYNFGPTDRERYQAHQRIEDGDARREQAIRNISKNVDEMREGFPVVNGHYLNMYPPTHPLFAAAQSLFIGRIADERTLKDCAAHMERMDRLR